MARLVKINPSVRSVEEVEEEEEEGEEGGEEESDRREDRDACLLHREISLSKGPESNNNLNPPMVSPKIIHKRQDRIDRSNVFLLENIFFPRKRLFHARISSKRSLISQIKRSRLLSLSQSSPVR